MVLLVVIFLSRVEDKTTGCHLGSLALFRLLLRSCSGGGGCCQHLLELLHWVLLLFFFFLLYNVGLLLVPFGGRLIIDEFGETLAVAEVPHSDASILCSSDDSSLRAVEARASDLAAFVCLAKLAHKLAVFDVPHGNEGSVVARDQRLKLVVVERNRDWILMGGLNLLLCFKLPLSERVRSLRTKD